MTLRLTLNESDEKRLVEEAGLRRIKPEEYADNLLAGALADPSRYIVLDPVKGPRIAGSRIKVSDIAIEGAYEGRTAQDAVEAYPHLKPASVFAALAYYHDHKDEIDRYIEETGKEFERLRAEAGPSDFELRMRAEGRID